MQRHESGGKTPKRKKSHILEQSESHLARNNHGNGLTHALGGMEFVEPEDFTLCSITASLRHEAQPSLQKENTEVTQARSKCNLYVTFCTCIHNV